MVQQFNGINRALDKCCILALQPIPNKQIALMTDASFGAAGYAVLVEDDPNQKFTSLRKSYAPVAYGSKTNLHTSPDNNVHLGKRISCDLLLLQRIRTYLECAETGHYPYRR